MENVSTILPNSTYSFVVAQEKNKQRIDIFLTGQFSHNSRTFFQKLIEAQAVRINNAIVIKPSFIIHMDDVISITFPDEKIHTTKAIPQELNVQIVHNHKHFLIIAKPPALLVHSPSHAHEEITLVDWLLSKFQEIRTVGIYDRPGIVHRLDKDTSGLLIIPRNNYAHAIFSDFFKNRLIKKKYMAIVEGHPPSEGSINGPIGRDSFIPTRMAINNFAGRDAITNYRVLQYFADTALLEVSPLTGRTHQIRVHCASIGHPIIGDIVYGKKSPYINRQALHAVALEFTFEDEKYSFYKDIPDDFKMALDILAKSK